MTEKNKAMTFGEWWNGFDLPSEITTAKTLTTEAEIIWNAARLNTIPADRAIEVPDVGEWPIRANSVILSYSPFSTEQQNRKGLWGLIKHIPRPVPAFVPRINDMVFFIDHKGHVDIGRIVTDGSDGSDGSNPSIRRSRNVDYYTQVKNIKPFDPSKIGLPWEAI